MQDYSTLLNNYPEIITLDQLYRICHISKRKAKWLLENNIIPCEDSGKKTWRFKIKLTDVITYLQTLEKTPEKVSAPVGIFSSSIYNKGKKRPIQNVDELKEYYYSQWAAVPNALKINDIAHLTGYTYQTVHGWTSKGLQCSRLPNGKKVIAKKWLVDFIATYNISSNNMSKIHKELLLEFMLHNK